MDKILIKSGVLQDARRHRAVLVGIAAKIDIVQQADHFPVRLFIAISLILCEPAHHLLHCQGVLDMKGLRVIMFEQADGLISVHSGLRKISGIKVPWSVTQFKMRHASAMYLVQFT